jgi:hypothetical protein
MRYRYTRNVMLRSNGRLLKRVTGCEYVKVRSVYENESSRSVCYLLKQLPCCLSTYGNTVYLFSFL